MNQFGEATANVNLNIESEPEPQGEPPTFVGKPQIKWDEGSGNVLMVVIVKADPKPSAAWSRGSVTIKSTSKCTTTITEERTDVYRIQMELRVQILLKLSMNISKLFFWLNLWLDHGRALSTPDQVSWFFKKSCFDVSAFNKPNAVKKSSSSTFKTHKHFKRCYNDTTIFSSQGYSLLAHDFFYQQQWFRFSSTLKIKVYNLKHCFILFRL